MENNCSLLINNSIQKGDLYVLKCNELGPSFELDLDNELTSILIDNLKDGQSLIINVKPHCSLNLSILEDSALKNFEITINLAENASLSAYFADFIIGDTNSKVSVKLNGEGSRAEWHLASLSSKEDNKTFEVCAYHYASNTYAKMENYGVCKDQARLVFSGESEIIKHANRTETHQVAKIMVFDKDSKAVAKPILKIDENDVIASHAAIVGEINEEHLFYLTSRGLSEEAAKDLITLGYLKPILKGFNDDEYKAKIESLIQGRM